MLAIHLFGDFRLTLGQKEQRLAALPKATPLLAHLLLRRNEPVDRLGLAFTLWPDVDESTAKGNLRRHLYDLARALPPEVKGRPWLLRQGGNLQWNPLAPHWLDVAAFEQAVQAGRDEEAIRLYAGQLLPLVDESWLILERERLRNLFLFSLQRLIDWQRQERRYAEAAINAQRLLSCDPLREDGARQLMLFRYALGDRARAVQVYQEFADLLERELGIAPMPETQALHDQILGNSPPSILLEAQLGSSAPGPSIAVLNSETAVPSPQFTLSLPQPLRPLIGRQTELAHLTELVVAKGRRLITLTGPSGSGKSRLALALAHTLARDHTAHFPDGLFFVSLAALSEPEQVFTAIAAATTSATAARTQPTTTTAAALAEALRYKRLLLLLDNFEHLLPAAETLAALLQAIPGLTVLVTSQTLLQLYGEQAFPLPGLQLPPRPPPAELADYEAVAFFCEAAQTANPYFQLNAANGPAIAHICHRLDGLPLALELAAARSSLLDPAEILAQLEDMLAFLSTPVRDVPDRHRSMEAALAWSYQLLGEAEQFLFASLSVFRGGFDLAGAAAVRGIDDGQTAVLLDSLKAKNLIQATHAPEEKPQLDMLFTIRAFAQAKLAGQGGEAMAQARHAAYYAGLCHFSSNDPAFNVGSHIARLAATQDNLLTAVAWLAAQPTLTDEQQEQLTWLLRLLPQIYFRYGRIKEGARWLAQVEARLDELPTVHQPAILSQFAALAREHGDYERAAAYLERAYMVAARLEDSYLISRTLLGQATLAGIREDYQRAVTLAEQAIALDDELRRGPMTAEKAHWWQNRALDLKYLERYSEALALLEEARQFLEGQADQMSLAGILHTIGGVYLAQAQYQPAASYYRQALRKAQAVNYPRQVWHALGGLAQVAAATGDWRQVATLYGAQNKLSLMLGFSSLPVAQRQKDDLLAQSQAALGTAVYRDAWLKGEQASIEDLL